MYALAKVSFHCILKFSYLLYATIKKYKHLYADTNSSKMVVPINSNLNPETRVIVSGNKN